MIVYLDENLPPALAAGLHELEQGLKYRSTGRIELRHVINEFGRGAKDEDWVRKAAMQKDSVIITEDRRMQRIKQLQPICREEKVVMIFFRPPARGLKYWDKVELSIKKWPEIKALARLARPAGYQVSVRGTPLRLW